MKQMTSHIIIGDYEFFYVSKVSVESSWQMLASTCQLEMPNTAGMLEKQVKPGDEVIVRLGYDGVYNEDFRGYVKSVSPGTPVRIECMDEMWKLRQETISTSWASATLKEVLAYVAPGAFIDVPAITLAPFRLDKVTRAEALEAIKEQYGLAVYFTGPQLVVNLPYAQSEPLEYFYHMQKNVATFGSLTYRRADDVRVKVKAISVLPDNTRHDVELGDKDGEQHTLHFYNLTPAELQQQAKQKLDLLKFDGYKGSFTAFGQPNAQHSSIADLQDQRYPERNGRYFIDKVVITYGPDGYRRELTLGKRAGNTVQQ